jgi:hypothetical protein
MRLHSLPLPFPNLDLPRSIEVFSTIGEASTANLPSQYESKWGSLRENFREPSHYEAIPRIL